MCGVAQIVNGRLLSNRMRISMWMRQLSTDTNIARIAGKGEYMKKDEAVKQMEFCLELAKRLLDDINNAEESSYNGCCYGRSKIVQDITRLRREMLVLKKGI